MVFRKLFFIFIFVCSVLSSGKINCGDFGDNSNIEDSRSLFILLFEFFIQNPNYFPISVSSGSIERKILNVFVTFLDNYYPEWVYGLGLDKADFSTLDERVLLLLRVLRLHSPEKSVQEAFNRIVSDIGSIQNQDLGDINFQYLGSPFEITHAVVLTQNFRRTSHPFFCHLFARADRAIVTGCEYPCLFTPPGRCYEQNCGQEGSEAGMLAGQFRSFLSSRNLDGGEKESQSSSFKQAPVSCGNSGSCSSCITLDPMRGSLSCPNPVNTSEEKNSSTKVNSEVDSANLPEETKETVQQITPVSTGQGTKKAVGGFDNLFKFLPFWGVNDTHGTYGDSGGDCYDSDDDDGGCVIL